jgi:hypothetical protein
LKNSDILKTMATMKDFYPVIPCWEGALPARVFEVLWQYLYSKLFEPRGDGSLEAL